MTSGALPMMTLAEARTMLPSAKLVGDGRTAFKRVHSDTRTLQPGDLFVALRGENFDGNQFLLQACAAGAVAALAERGLSPQLPGLEVADSLAALQQLSGAWRARFQLPLAAVVGSNGKTTVTQMTAAILRSWLGDGAFATQGNLNNHIGVPLMLLKLRDDAKTRHRAAVLELGMNHAGEIALLARLSMPTAALIVNAQREHQEFLDGVEAVARENASVIDVLPASGTVVLPATDQFTPLWRRLSGPRRVITFAVDASADVSGSGEWMPSHASWRITLNTPAGLADTELRQAGVHNLRNAVAAAACAIALGAPLSAIVQGLSAFEPVSGRSRPVALVRGGKPVTLIDDSYNANPDSVRAAIDLLMSLPGPHWLVLGDMGEVGDQGPAFHAEVGVYARERGVETVWTAGKACVEVWANRTAGDEAANDGAAGNRSAGVAPGDRAPGGIAAGDRHFAEVPALIEALPQGPQAASILVKGSRFMEMERVVQALQAASPPPSNKAGA